MLAWAKGIACKQIRVSCFTFMLHGGHPLGERGFADPRSRKSAPSKSDAHFWWRARPGLRDLRDPLPDSIFYPITSRASSDRLTPSPSTAEGPRRLRHDERRVGTFTGQSRNHYVATDEDFLMAMDTQRDCNAVSLRHLSAESWQCESKSCSCR
jgi:hypothetical protein